MDSREAERRFGQLQENYSNGAITEQAFYQAVSTLMVQDSQGCYWAIDPKTGGWLVYDGQMWQPAGPSPGDATERIPLVSSSRHHRETWLVALLAGGVFLIGFLLIVGLTAYWGWKWNGHSLPQVTISAPLHGAEFEVGHDVTVEADCSDSSGISRVELWVDDDLVIPETSLPSGSPISVTLHWIFRDPGLHKLIVKAYNASGGVGVSEPVVVRAVTESRQRGPTAVVLEGSLQIRPAGGTKWQPAENGTSVQVGDAVRTLESGRAQLVFPEGLVAELGNSSELLLERMESESAQALSIRVVSPYGDTWHRLDAGPVQVHYEIETPAALVTLRGTLVHITILAMGETLVEVVEGDAMVVGAEQRRHVLEGQVVKIEAGKPPLLIEGLEQPPQLEGAATKDPVCTPAATLGADVSLPDGVVLQPGQRIEKIWRIRNTGTCPWVDYTLSFVSGDQMSEMSEVPVLQTEPGGTADIGVLLEAPSQAGSFVEYWQLKDAAGRTVGPAARVQISVPTAAVPTPLPTRQPHTAATLEPLVRSSSDRDYLEQEERARLQWDVE